MKPTEIQIRYVDLDSLGHVNTANYLSYFEIARVSQFEELLGENWDWVHEGFILAKTEVEFLRSLKLKDRPTVSIITESIGNKSFVLSYEIKVGDELCAKGDSTLVCFNSATNETISIPPVMREALAKLKLTN